MLKAQKSLLAAYKTLSTIDSWDKVPLSDKDHIRKMKVPAKFAELRVTSGSTGEPLYVYYSKEAVEAFLNRAVISLRKSGVTNTDVVLNLFAYGNFVPGSMYERACYMEGISVMPLGAPNTYPKEKVIKAITTVKPNVWLSVPSYAITLLGLLEQDKKTSSFPKKIIVAGEKLLDVYINKFNEYGIEVINHFGLTECPAIGVSKRDNPKVIEIINEGIYSEIVEKDGMKYLVVTDLNNFSTPIIKYKTGDAIGDTKINPDGTLVEISITARTDDLIKIQAVLVSKTKIIETLLNFTTKFVVYIKTKNGRDFVEVILDQKYKKLKQKIDDELDFLKKRKLMFRKQFQTPITSSYKSKFIIDLRQ